MVGFRATLQQPLAAAVLAAVAVVVANDVVLAQVAARLHLNDMQRNASRVLNTMSHPDRYEGRLVLFEQEHFIAARNARGPRYHHPVLGAVGMHLQRQHASGAHDEPLDLKALAVVDAVVAAPRSK